MASGGRTRELRQIAGLLGAQVTEETPNEEIKRQIEAKIVEMFASKGIKPKVTVKYAPNAPGKLAGKQIVVGSTDVSWSGSYPSIKSEQGHFYAAHNAAVYATVVK